MRAKSWLGRTLLVLVLPSTLALGGCATSGGRASAPTQAETDALQRQRQAASHYNLGTSYLHEGQLALAIRELRVSREMQPEDKWTPLALAEAYRRKGLFRDAEQELRRALELDPSFQQARLTLSAVYIELGHPAEALREADLLVQDPTFPQPWTALTNRGWALYKLGRIGDAVEALETAVQYHEGYWRAILNLGIIKAERGERGDAMAHFERVIALEPGPLAEAEAYYRLAEIYISMGDRDRAIEHLTAAAKRRPSGAWGKRSEEYLDRLR